VRAAGCAAVLLGMDQMIDWPRAAGLEAPTQEAFAPISGEPWATPTHLGLLHRANS